MHSYILTFSRLKKKKTFDSFGFAAEETFISTSAVSNARDSDSNKNHINCRHKQWQKEEEGDADDDDELMMKGYEDEEKIEILMASALKT